MKNNLISTLLVLFAWHSFAQINYERGYFIDNNNQRVECLIKNIEWKNNPTEFEYKKAENGIAEKGTFSSAKEFGIMGSSRFVRANTKIDLSSTDVNSLSKTSDPEWSQQILFLKVIVEGRATLYYYENSGLIRFFYSFASDTVVNQLIFKEYFDQKDKYFEEKFEISSNKQFKEQLWIHVRCSNTSTTDIRKLVYRKSDLVKYFLNYNDCNNSSNVIYEEKKGKDLFHLKISPGINSSSLSVINTTDNKYSTDFDNQLNFRTGVEAEYILPFNKNKWGIFFEPTYQYFYDEEQMPTFKAVITLNTVEFPIGLRHYFFLNKKLKLFANVIFIPSYSLNFNSTFEKQSTTQSILASYLKINPSHSFALGGGIGYKKLNAEMRYSTNRNLLNKYASWYTDYFAFSLILGYRIL